MISRQWESKVGTKTYLLSGQIEYSVIVSKVVLDESDIVAGNGRA